VKLGKLLVGFSVGLIDLGLELSGYKVAGVDAVDIGRGVMFGGSVVADLVGIGPKGLWEEIEVATAPLVVKSGYKMLKGAKVGGFERPRIVSSPSPAPAPTAVSRAISF